MYVSVILLCTALGCFSTWIWWQTRHMRHHLKHLPSRNGAPFLGNTMLKGGGDVLYRIITNMARLSDETNLPSVVWIGLYPLLMFIDAEDIKMVTNSFVEKPYLYSFGKVWLGNGLVTAPGSIWKHTIKKIGGTFTTNTVDGYLDVFNVQMANLVNKFEGKVGGEPFDAMHDICHTTIETICQTALGASGLSETIVTQEYYHALERILELITSRGMNMLLHPDLIYKFTPAYKEMERCAAILQKLSKTILTKRIAEWKASHDQQNQELPVPSKAKFKSFLDHLLEMSANDPVFTIDQIQAEVDTIIIGGYETIATNLTFILLVLGWKQQVQDKLYAEFQEIFGDSDRPVTKEDLGRMKYCEAVINETLRLYPSVTAVLRYADKDLQLKSCLVPKGTGCCINIWGAGHSKRAWGKDAYDFRPERWLDPDVDTSSFFPFSYGRRSCIGKKYAMSLEKIMLAYCIRKYKFTSEAEKLKLKIDLALRPTAGNLLQVHYRISPKKETEAVH